MRVLPQNQLLMKSCKHTTFHVLCDPRIRIAVQLFVIESKEIKHPSGVKWVHFLGNGVTPRPIHSAL